MIALRLALAVIGAAMLAAAGLLYENEEGVVQSKLEALWISLDDRSVAMLGRHGAFLSRAGVVTEVLLSKVVGDRAISWRLIRTSLLGTACGGLAALALYASAIDPRGVWWLFLVAGILAILIFAPAVNARLAPISSCAAIVVIAAAVAIDIRVQSVLGCPLSKMMALGLVSDVTAIKLLRAILRRACAARNPGVLVVFGCVFFMTAVLVLVLPPWALSLALTPVGVGRAAGIRVEALAVPLVGANAFAAFPFLAFTGVTLSYAGHHVIWPLLLRPLYFVQRTGVFQHRPTVASIGAGSLILALHPQTISLTTLGQLLGAPIEIQATTAAVPASAPPPSPDRTPKTARSNWRLPSPISVDPPPIVNRNPKRPK